jgi:hypothetical protein
MVEVLMHLNISYGYDITIVLLEPPLENWGIRGGKPANDAELGFNINV